MPAALTPIGGDPYEVTSTARMFTSIATEVAAHATKLRALAGASSRWEGAAATTARVRAATLPPELDKVEASYAIAGGALRTYASALAEAQRESAAAIAAAARADADLQSARAAHVAAIAADTAASAVAHGANLPPPPSTAPRYEDAINEASIRLGRATAANREARDVQQRAAIVAAAALSHASHKGIRNQSRWHHFSHAVTHWAAKHWANTLRDLSKIAADISVIAGIAAVVLAVGSAFFPPLAAAAGLAESVAFISGMVANDSAAAVALANPRTRRAGLIGLAEAVVPTAGRTVMKVLPKGLASRAMGVAAQGGAAADATVPLGFATREEFHAFGTRIRVHLDEAGYPDTVGIMQGSAVTGRKFTTGAPFDVGRRSDFDVALAGPDLHAAAIAVGVPMRSHGLRSAPLNPAQLEHLGLGQLSRHLNATAGRKVFFMVYRSPDDAIARRPGIVMPQ